MINEFGVLEVRLYEQDHDLYQTRFGPAHVSPYRKQVAAAFEKYNNLYDEFLAYRMRFSDKSLIPLKVYSAQTGAEEWTVPAFCSRPEPKTDKEQEEQDFLHMYYINAWLELRKIIKELAETDYVQFKYQYCQFLSSPPADIDLPDPRVVGYGDYFLVRSQRCIEEYKRWLYALVYTDKK